MKKLLLSIDQGTTSSRSILFDLKGKKIFSSQIEFEQIFPNSGWVEHNPEEIWKVTLKTIKEAIKKSKKLKSKIISIGIKEKQLYFGIKILENQFIMRLFGKIEEHKKFVRILKKEN